MRLKRWFGWVLILGGAWAVCAAADLTAYPEHVRPDPFGGVVQPDRAAGASGRRELAVESARAAHVSFQLAAAVPEGGAYKLTIAPFASDAGLRVELFREWFHYVPAEKSYFPDALVPSGVTYSSRMPEPDNRVPGQTVQSFWVDIWVGADARVGTHAARALLEAGGKTVGLPVRLTVLEPRVPAEDAVSIDHNSYGTSWLGGDYPALRKQVGSEFYTSDAFFQLIQAHHRIFYEHRGVFHQLGYGHAGKVGPEFAPRLEGTGKSKHIADWTLFDRHYGPLFDGTAFTGTERGARPIPYVYLPVNPEWPATFLAWGEPGYEREFVNVMSEMERHFREKGWTGTRFELFFNHKKRYKGFPWDGDEARFTKDYAYPREYARLMKLAVPSGTPVKFVFRADVSWTMERQFRELAGVIDFWVCGGGMVNWYPEAVREVKKRGDIVWTYGGTPLVSSPVSAITIDVLRPWVQGVDGFVHWLATSPGKDPWFEFEGGAEALIYPGDRFGIAGPIPSIRLKVQRNAVEDLSLLQSFLARDGAERVRAEIVRRFNGTRLEDWWMARPALADTNPEDWTNASIDDAAKDPKFAKPPDLDAWQRVHAYALELSRRAQ